MRHKMRGESNNVFGSPHLLLPHNASAAPLPPSDHEPRAAEDLTRGGESAFLPLETRVDGEEYEEEEDAFPLEANDGEVVESGEDDDVDGEEEDGEEEEEEEEAAAVMEEDEEEEIVATETSEGERMKLAEGFFEVEAIRRKRICKGEAQYFIKWRGWPESANTWEPLEHLNLCPDVVEVYEQSLQSGKKTRKRKRKYTQPKKKLQYSYAGSGSKENDVDVKKPRLGRRPSEKKPLREPSSTLGSKETKDDENSNEKDNDTRKITIQLQEVAKGDGSSVNSSCKADSAEPIQGDRRTGAKRRKSGSVQRFKPDSSTSDPSHAANSIPVNGSYDGTELIMVGNVDAYPKIKFDISRESSVITRILKPIGYSTSKSDDIEDVSVTFVAMRSDGKEVVVDNKFLKANYPHVLIDFYEQHLRYSPAA